MGDLKYCVGNSNPKNSFSILNVSILINFNFFDFRKSIGIVLFLWLLIFVTKQGFV